MKPTEYIPRPATFYPEVRVSRQYRREERSNKLSGASWTEHIPLEKWDVMGPIGVIRTCGSEERALDLAEDWQRFYDKYPPAAEHLGELVRQFEASWEYLAYNAGAPGAGDRETRFFWRCRCKHLSTHPAKSDTCAVCGTDRAQGLRASVAEGAIRCPSTPGDAL